MSEKQMKKHGLVITLQSDSSVLDPDGNLIEITV